VRGDAHVDLLGVELGHFDGVGDELVEAVTLFVDDGEEFVAGVGGEGHGEQGADGGFDGGEGSAEVVGDGVEHDAAEPLALFGGFGAGDLLDGAGAVEGDGDETAEGFEGLAGEGNAAEDEDAAGTDAGAEGDDGLMALGGGGGDVGGLR